MTGKLIEIGDLDHLQDCPEPKSGVVILIDRAQLKAERNLFGEIVTVCGGNPDWKTSEPPKDGTPIIAKGRIIYNDESGGDVTPYIGEICWDGTQWVYQSLGWPISVTCSPDETFVIDWWIEPPRVESVNL